MKLIFNTVLICFYCFCGIGFAATEDQVNKFLEVSGYNKQLEQFPVLIGKGIEMAYQQKKDIPENLKTKMKSLAAENFKPELIKISVKKTVMKNVSDEDMKKVLDFYETETAKYFTELEIKGSDPEVLEKLKTFDPESLDKAVRDEIDEIFYGLNMLENTLETQRIVIISMFQVVNASLPEDKQKSSSDINRILKKTVESNRPVYEKLLKKNLYLIYQPASLSKIKIYRNYLNSIEVKNFYREFTKGKQEAIKISAEKFGIAIVEEFKKLN